MPDLLILSGGQTGVDLAALYAAEDCKISYRGWVPLHYTNETGEYGIPEHFRPALRETSTTASAERTEKNIQDADGILTLLMEPEAGQDDALLSSPGTKLGIDHARKLGKRDEQLYFVNLAKVDLQKERHKVVTWLLEQDIHKCAIGGPRESEAEGIEKKAYNFLLGVFQEYKDQNWRIRKGDTTSYKVVS